MAGYHIRATMMSLSGSRPNVTESFFSGNSRVHSGVLTTRRAGRLGGRMTCVRAAAAAAATLAPARVPSLRSPVPAPPRPRSRWRVEVQLEGPHLHHVAVVQRLLHLDRELDAVDEGAVGAAQVHDAAAAGVGQYARVVQGDGGIGQGEIVVRRTAHVDGGLLRPGTPRSSSLPWMVNVPNIWFPASRLPLACPDSDLFRSIIPLPASRLYCHCAKSGK